MAPITTSTTTTTTSLPSLQLRGSRGPLRPPTFTSKEQEQRYAKERLAGAFRIFHKLGYDETIAGHISVSRREAVVLLPISSLGLDE